MSIDQDKLDIALEKKQNSMLDIKQGFYSPSEGEDGDTGGCIHNGVFYYAIKANNQWQFISMQDAGKLETAQNKRKFDIENVVKDNIAKYLAPYLLQINQDLLAALIGKENWAVHHSFTANFDNTPQINYLQYGTGDVNEINGSSGRFFVVPFGCKLKNINFVIWTPVNTTGGDVTYTFTLYVQSATPSNTTFANVITPLSFSVVVADTESIGLGNLVVNATLSMDEYYVVYILQTVFPGGLNATKQGKATSYFSSI